MKNICTENDRKSKNNNRGEKKKNARRKTRAMISLENTQTRDFT